LVKSSSAAKKKQTDESRMKTPLGQSPMFANNQQYATAGGTSSETKSVSKSSSSNLVPRMKQEAAKAVEKDERYRNLVNPYDTSQRINAPLSSNILSDSIRKTATEVYSTHAAGKENILENLPLYMPPHLYALKSALSHPAAQSVTIPIMSQLSPRSRRKISQLPAPTEEIGEMVERIVGKASLVQPEGAYRTLSKNIDIHNRQGTSLSAKLLDPTTLPPPTSALSSASSSSLASSKLGMYCNP
jgi:hypothetical protein